MEEDALDVIYVPAEDNEFFVPADDTYEIVVPPRSDAD